MWGEDKGCDVRCVGGVVRMWVRRVRGVRWGGGKGCEMGGGGERRDVGCKGCETWGGGIDAGLPVRVVPRPGTASKESPR